MSKERISRRAFVRLGLGLAGGALLYETGKRLPFFQSLQEFSQEEIEQFEGIDIALIFNPAGWGYTSLEEDRNWQEILENIKEELENRGYKTKIFEEFRRKGPFSPLSASTENTTKKIEELTKLFPELKIVLTGRSSGATFAEGILEAFLENNQILAIEAIRPFEKKNPLVAPERTLVIENPELDPLQQGNIREILKAFLSPTIFRIPEHDSCCSWNLRVAETVKEFLDTHFPAK